MQTSSGSERARRTLAFLRHQIITGQWPINSRIPIESELMEMLGVGKTTVREAVRSLASVGMLETLPGRGTFVRSRTPVSAVLTDTLAEYDLAEVLVLRRALEVEAVQQAAVQRTEDQLAALRGAHDRDVPTDPDYPGRVERGRTPGQFHFLVFEAGGSPLLTSMYAVVMATLRRAVDQGRLTYGASEDLRRDDHAAILAAIESGDIVAAAHAMARHVDRDLVIRTAG
ncbi:MAG: FadR family transcriptional regulator [Propionibacteriaceae bacterium]|nr:FadR family transcriptional regulator [Propionibacteriaceae bacterium]